MLEKNFATWVTVQSGFKNSLHNGQAIIYRRENIVYFIAGYNKTLGENLNEILIFYPNNNSIEKYTVWRYFIGGVGDGENGSGNSTLYIHISNHCWRIILVTL